MGISAFQRGASADYSASGFAATVSVPYLEPIDPADPRATAPPDSGVPDVITDFGPDSTPDGDTDGSASQPTLSNIGRYALKQQLGEGGLGAVYEAWDPLLSRMVAVKTLQFDIDTPTRVSLDAMFLNEARTAAGLNHAYIVTVHDAGLSARGVYIAMERLRGRDLRCALRAGWRPTPVDAALLARRVADALAYAHARGVVHCDIKPANIFLTRHDKPKVLDFGIARVAHQAALPGMDGVVAGSPHYLAPEQLRGGSVDARTDLYSLGVVLYELLTGRKAFEGDSLEQISTAVLTNHPAAPHALCPAVPESLSQIVQRAISRDADARFQNAAEMVQALRQWAAGQARRDSAEVLQQAAARAAAVKPRRTRQALAAAAVLCTTVGAALWFAATPAAAPSGAAPHATAAQAPLPMVAAAPVAAAALPPAAVAPQPDETVMSPDADAAAAPPQDEAPPNPVVVAAAAPKAPTAKPRKPPARRAAAPAAAAAAEAAVAPPSTGVVQIAISPWGQVEVDGAAAGITPPLTRLQLSAGSHTITVRNEDFPPFTRQIRVDPEQPVSIKHRFGSLD